MSLFNVFEIAGSSLSAQSTRLNTTASNLANAESISSSRDQTYRARYPVFSTAMNQALEARETPGVNVLGIVESTAPLQVEYHPEHPLANEDGNIFMPNVNPIEEMANMISASRSYQSSVEVLNTSKQLLIRTLSLGQ